MHEIKDSIKEYNKWRNVYNESNTLTKSKTTKTIKRTWFPRSLLMSESKNLTMLSHGPLDDCWGIPRGDLDSFAPCIPRPVLGA